MNEIKDIEVFCPECFKVTSALSYKFGGDVLFENGVEEIITCTCGARLRITIKVEVNDG